jgi:hypothetical protein
MDISGRYQGASWLHTFEDFWVLNGSALKITPLFLFGGMIRLAKKRRHNEITK